MSAAEETGFMGRPPAAPVTTVDDLTAPPKPPPSSERPYHWAYSMPPSITDQYHWHGTDADLHYGLIEPSLEQLAQIGRDPDRQVRDIAVGFVRALGKLGKDGKVILGDEVVLDDKGQPVLEVVLDDSGKQVLDPVTLTPNRQPKRHPKLFPVGYIEVEAWFGRIGPKGAQLVVGEFQACFQPSKAEGEAHRASRRRG